MHPLDELSGTRSPDGLIGKRPSDKQMSWASFVSGTYSNGVQHPLLEENDKEVLVTRGDASRTVTLSSGRTHARSHTKRAERKKFPVRVKVMERDTMILRALRDMKFLSTGQIALLCFGRLTSTVRLRLRKLLDAGLIKSWVPSLQEENYYSLTVKGLSTIHDEDASQDASIPVPRRLERRLLHLRCINDVRVALSLAVSKEGGEVIDWQSDWQLKRPRERNLVPDALFTLRLREQGLSFALEVDLATEPAATVFAEKLRSYRVRSEILLIVVPTTRRLATLLDIAAQEPRAADFLFTLKEQITPGSIFRQIWTSPRRAYAETHEATFVSIRGLFEHGGGELNG